MQRTHHQASDNLPGLPWSSLAMLELAFIERTLVTFHITALSCYCLCNNLWMLRFPPPLLCFKVVRIVGVFTHAAWCWNVAVFWHWCSGHRESIKYSTHTGLFSGRIVMAYLANFIIFCQLLRAIAKKIVSTQNACSFVLLCVLKFTSANVLSTSYLQSLPQILVFILIILYLQFHNVGVPQTLLWGERELTYTN